MTEIPAMMLWTDAYLGDTSHLTTTEHGAYLLILMAMWRAGGALPHDELRLARTARLSLDKWRRVAPTIMSFMTVGDGNVSIKPGRHVGPRGRVPIPPEVQRLIFERDGFVCAYCDDAAGPFEIDHVHPVKKGGTNHPENLRVACKSCNCSKGAKFIGDWLQ